ncbi:SCP2 sterol-binding domain-containing protein [Myxococcota bacterium]|nr:SCP2 sterol-binding domain-containing protein [Myxococcota bacterium]
MADTLAFFNEYLPAKIAKDPSLKNIGKVFLFKITGAGAWTLNLTEGTVVEGEPATKADCTVTCDKDNWEKMLDKPSLAMQLFMTRKLTADNVGLATKLQQILG